MPDRDSCKDCPERSYEPNCHNVETCEHWRRHMEEQQRKYDARKLTAQMKKPPPKYEKHGKNSRYFTGNKENLSRTRKGCTTVKGGQDVP